MTKSLDPRARIAAQKSLRRTVLCTAGRAIIAAILFAIACVTAPEASAQLDSVLKNLLQNAMPTAPTTPPNYRPVYPPPPYPSYPPQPAAPPNPAYRAYSAPPPAPSAAAPAVADAGRVADLQRMLNELGYDAGPADGQPGSRTVQAVRAFQRDHGQPVTGEMTEVTVAAVRGVWYERSRSAGAMPAAAGPSAVRPSFDCARASNPTERQICASPQLATLDARLSQAFGNASADKSPDDRASLMADEQRWLQQRNACGGDAACIERSINEHLAQLQAPRAVDNGGQEPARGLVVSGARDSSQPPTSAASTAPVGISVDELLHPSQGLRPLRLRIWDGMPLLHHSDSSDTEAFLDLVTLGIRPDLLEVKDSLLDQVAEYSRTFLNRADPLNAQNWSTRNEFEKKDARAAFLRQYAEPLRRLAPRAPFRFAYATAASLGRYDVKRRGFDLTGMGSYALQRVDPLQPGGIQLVHGRIGVVPRYDFDMPSPFWPIEEAAARALIAPLFGPNDRGERRVQAITVFEATDAEPQTVTLGLQIERLEIWDDPLTTRLYSFDVAPLRHQKLSTASSLQRLLHPPAELRPWPLSSLDGRPAIGAYDVWEASFQKWVLAADLFRLVAAGTIPGYLEDRNNLPSVQHMFSDQVIREVFLGGPGGWAGSDEFAQARARETYYSRYAPVLRKLAPRPPFEFIYVQDAMLGPYVAERRAFPVNQQNDSGDLLQRVREANLIPAPTFSPAGLFWPIDPGRAEAILNTLSNRKVKTAATYQIASLDSASKRLVINLKALSLYTPDLKTKLYEFPVSNDPEPYLSAGTPARLKVTEQAALDDLFFCLKFIEAGGEQISMQIVAKCWNVVAERDKRFYTRSDHGADLALDDARRPFFPRGGADPTSAAMARFLEWAKIYAASLPETVAAPPSIGIPYGTRLAQVLAEGKAPQRERYAKLLSEKHLQEDQLIYINSPLYYNGESVEIIFILPNRRALYSMTVPKEALDRHPGTNPQSVANFRVGAARIIRNDLGQKVLATDLTPLSIKTFVGDDALASRTFDDIPRLDALAFTPPAPQPAPAINSGQLALDPANEAKRKAAEDVRKAAFAVFQGETSGLDVLGIRLGTSYADAEALIRKHMQVGWVLTNADSGKSDQVTSMRIFVTPDQREYIALFDSPKHAPEKVIGARRFLKLSKTVSDDAIAAMLSEKYGPPVSTNTNGWEWGATGKPPCQVLGETPSALVVSEGAPLDRSALLQTPTSTIRVAFLDGGDLGKFGVCGPQIHIERGRYTSGEGVLSVGLFDVRIYATLLRPDGLAPPAATAVRIPF